MSRTQRVLAAVIAALLLSGTAVAAERLLLPPPSGEGVLTLLLLGSDGGPPRGDQMIGSRADGFQLLFVSGDRQHATFVSIPRDSYVAVSGMGTTRINACLVRGPENCVTTVAQVFGVQVDGYLLTSMNGFMHGVEAFGGLTVDVPTPVFDGGIDIPQAGRQHLNGGQALTYGRDRKNRPGGDFGRTQAQAEMLALAHAEVVADASVPNLLKAARVIRRHSVTNIPGPHLVRLAFEALHLPPGNVQRFLAEGSPTMIGGASVVQLHQRAYDIIRDASADGRVGGG